MLNISFKRERGSHFRKKTGNPSAESRRLWLAPGRVAEGDGTPGAGGLVRASTAQAPACAWRGSREARGGWPSCPPPRPPAASAAIPRGGSPRQGAEDGDGACTCSAPHSASVARRPLFSSSL